MDVSDVDSELIVNCQLMVLDLVNLRATKQEGILHWCLGHSAV